MRIRLLEFAFEVEWDVLLVPGLICQFLNFLLYRNFIRSRLR